MFSIKNHDETYNNKEKYEKDYNKFYDNFVKILPTKTITE